MGRESRTAPPKENVQRHAERVRHEIVQRAVDRRLCLRRAVQGLVHRHQDGLDAVRVLADHQRAEQLQLRLQRIHGRAHVRRGGGVAETLHAVVSGDADDVPVGHRARGQRKAPGRVLLAHAAGRYLEVADDHGAVLPDFLSAVDVSPASGSAPPHLHPDLEAWVLAGAIAAQTKKIEIMPAVHPGIVTPQVVAKMAATLDRISGGRCAVNIVNGWWKEEFNLFGNGTWLEREDARYRRMDEYLRVMKGLWTEDSFSLDGEFYRVDAGSLPTKPYRRPHPPLYTGSRSPTAKEIVARLCDVMFVWVRPGHRLFEQNFNLIADDIADMNARARSHGRALRYGINCHVICADSAEAAEAQADALEATSGTDFVSALIAKALGGGLVGTPDLIAERIRRFETIGIECLMLTFHPMLAGLETFATKVMPLLGRSRPEAAAAPRALARA